MRARFSIEAMSLEFHTTVDGEPAGYALPRWGGALDAMQAEKFVRWCNDAMERGDSPLTKWEHRRQRRRVGPWEDEG